MGKLINCSDCKRAISKNAKICPGCGAKNKQRKSLLGFIVVAIILFFIISQFSGTPETNKFAPTQSPEIRQEIEAKYEQEKQAALAEFNTNPTPQIGEINNLIDQKIYGSARYKIDLLKDSGNAEVMQLDVKLADIEEEIQLEQEKADLKAHEEAEKLRSAELWYYSQTEDPMSNGITSIAGITSENTVNFDFPYAGAQRGELVLRTDPKHGKDIIFSIQQGQLLCTAYDGCKILVRFDDQEPVSFSGVSPADNSTETVFIKNYSRFVEKMMKAKRVRISMNIYQEGAPVFEFDVSGFDKNKYLP